MGTVNPTTNFNFNVPTEFQFKNAWAPLLNENWTDLDGFLWDHLPLDGSRDMTGDLSINNTAGAVRLFNTADFTDPAGNWLVTASSGNLSFQPRFDGATFTSGASLVTEIDSTTSPGTDREVLSDMRLTLGPTVDATIFPFADSVATRQRGDARWLELDGSNEPPLGIPLSAIYRGTGTESFSLSGGNSLRGAQLYLFGQSHPSTPDEVHIWNDSAHVYRFTATPTTYVDGKDVLNVDNSGIKLPAGTTPRALNALTGAELTGFHYSTGSLTNAPFAGIIAFNYFTTRQHFFAVANEQPTVKVGTRRTSDGTEFWDDLIVGQTYLALLDQLVAKGTISQGEADAIYTA